VAESDDVTYDEGGAKTLLEVQDEEDGEVEEDEEREEDEDEEVHE